MFHAEAEQILHASEKQTGAFQMLVVRSWTRDLHDDLFRQFGIVQILDENDVPPFETTREVFWESGCTLDTQDVDAVMLTEGREDERRLLLTRLPEGSESRTQLRTVAKQLWSLDHRISFVALPLTPPLNLPEGDHEDPEWLKYPTPGEGSRETHVICSDGTRVSLVGVLPPDLLLHLADQRVTLLTTDADKKKVSLWNHKRDQRLLVELGTVAVDLSSWDGCSYCCASSPAMAEGVPPSQSPRVPPPPLPRRERERRR